MSLVSSTPTVAAPKQKRSTCASTASQRMEVPTVSDGVDAHADVEDASSIRNVFMPLVRVSVYCSPTLVAPVPGGAAYASLPAVSITHPVGSVSGRLCTRVSYGELSEAQVASVTDTMAPGSPLDNGDVSSVGASVVAASAMEADNNSDSTESSDVRSVDANLFVDNLADEGSGSSGADSGTSDVDASDDYGGSTASVGAEHESDCEVSPVAVEPPVCESKTSGKGQKQRVPVSVPAPIPRKGTVHGSKSRVMKGKAPAQSSTLGATLDLIVLAATSPLLPTPNKTLTLLKPGSSSPAPTIQGGKVKTGKSTAAKATPFNSKVAASASRSAAVTVTPTLLQPALPVPVISSATQTLLDNLDALIGFFHFVLVIHCYLNANIRDEFMSSVSNYESDHDDDVQATPVASSRYCFTVRCTYAPEPVEEEEPEPTDPAMCVMLPELQEDQLREFYATLLLIGGQSAESFEHPPYLTLDAILSLFPRDAVRVMAGGQTVVGIMPGTVTESYLYGVLDVAGGGRPYRGLRILPFSQPWCRESTMLGLAVGRDEILSNCINSLGVEFTTRHFSDKSKNQNLCTFPVFGGRATGGRQFLFRPEDFDSLSSMPCCQPSRELSCFTMVAVGYTPGIWKLFNQECRVSLNVQFVIMLVFVMLVCPNLLCLFELHELYLSGNPVGLLLIYLNRTLKMFRNDFVLSVSSFSSPAYVKLLAVLYDLSPVLSGASTSNSTMARWQEIITPISHSAIILHMPARWATQLSLRSRRIGIAFTMEMAVLCMLHILNQLRIATRVVYDGWPLSHFCLFYGILPSVSDVVIRGDRLLDGPTIPFSFMLPSMITDLSLKQCSFGEGHSLRAMLHRVCVLQCFDLRCISMGVSHASYCGMSLSQTLPLSTLCLDFNIGSGPMTTPAERRAIAACDVNYDLLSNIIDSYDSALSVSERLSRVSAGSHIYYSYMHRLIHLASHTGSLLWESIDRHLDSVNAIRALYPSLPTSEALDSIVPVSVPEHVLPELLCRLISRACVFEKHLAFETEIDVSTMIMEYSIERDVWGVRHINWPIFPHNWFLHLLPCVENVSFESLSDQFEMGDIPCIPHPYLLPPSVVELNLAGVSFLSNSIEGILSPDGHLEQLYIDSVDYGGIDVDPTSPFFVRREKRDLLGLMSYRAPFIVSPTVLTLHYMKIDLWFDTNGILTENHNVNAIGGTPSLLHQLFHSSTGIGELAHVLEPGETFPLQTRTSMLEELDLALGTQYYNGLNLGFPMQIMFILDTGYPVDVPGPCILMDVECPVVHTRWLCLYWCLTFHLPLLTIICLGMDAIPAASLSASPDGITHDDLDYIVFVSRLMSVEHDITSIAASFEDGTHPYFAFQTSVLNVMCDDSARLYSSLHALIRDLEMCYPFLCFYDSTSLARTTDSLTSDIVAAHVELPLEILDLVFAYFDVHELLAFRFVCQIWCYGTTCLSHSELVLQMPRDWQRDVSSEQCKEDAVLLALAYKLCVACSSVKWMFMLTVTSLILENWPGINVPFFYRIFLNLCSVEIRGTYSPMYYPRISLPFILPARITSVTITRCMVWGHSIEAMLSLCDRLESVSLSYLLYRHVVAPSPCISLEGVLAWRDHYGLDSFMRAAIVTPPPLTLRRLHLNFPDIPPYVLSTTANACLAGPRVLILLMSTAPLTLTRMLRELFVSANAANALAVLSICSTWSSHARITFASLRPMLGPTTKNNSRLLHGLFRVTLSSPLPGPEVMLLLSTSIPAVIPPVVWVVHPAACHHAAPSVRRICGFHTHDISFTGPTEFFDVFDSSYSCSACPLSLLDSVVHILAFSTTPGVSALSCHMLTCWLGCSSFALALTNGAVVFCPDRWIENDMCPVGWISPVRTYYVLWLLPSVTGVMALLFNKPVQLLVLFVCMPVSRTYSNITWCTIFLEYGHMRAEDRRWQRFYRHVPEADANAYIQDSSVLVIHILLDVIASGVPVAEL
ncbi:hypothetical protein ARMSODRAFT_982660 [Armillaria solidipes]|uniref:F-box domain-containing protein n=1 Tax=Armillaria solidipes TaxID=1076256 RepID=A0A2H3AMA8_9AGAR|nr:hypothetical protein ARMSODRAFT_982660 [Armillaria solidipes]